MTGGGTFLGDKIAAALLAEGSPVSLLVREGGEERLGPLAQRTRCLSADVWSPASLRGQARNHAAVIHTVGSLKADPSRGLSFERLNFVSARNVANMCVSDGVPRMILLSGVGAPWVNRAYIRSKRQAEAYMTRVGLSACIVRAPLVYAPSQSRPLFYRVLSWLGVVPPMAWFYPGRIAPMAIDALARGVARLALDEACDAGVYHARDLRRIAKQGMQAPVTIENAAGAYDSLDEDMPFGWSPRDGGA